MNHILSFALTCLIIPPITKNIETNVHTANTIIVILPLIYSLFQILKLIGSRLNGLLSIITFTIGRKIKMFNPVKNVHIDALNKPLIFM